MSLTPRYVGEDLLVPIAYGLTILLAEPGFLSSFPPVEQVEDKPQLIIGRHNQCPAHSRRWRDGVQPTC